ncbi:hypothetical protein [Aporhodopirellula aestuarii]|uniref:Uncharacterized protein n=1 Tax=Aporhodopirellula aestuarii TaxID=2950107 RepID=A0ABT0U548_9BACT|nr:hypothetical protein [Aporhodopirellula aestuarii]MCM2372064.1 hypothetical protein [Aporhodopirellula aestuarii]
MPNDLEEFLRRAAAIRQQKSLEIRAEAQRQAEQETRSRPRQYTSALHERRVDAAQFGYDDEEEDEHVVGIEILEEETLERELSDRSTGLAPSEHSAGIPHASGGPVKTRPSTASEIRAMFQRPGGVRQAFLVREILNRPRF